MLDRQARESVGGPTSFLLQTMQAEGTEWLCLWNTRRSKRKWQQGGAVGSTGNTTAKAIYTETDTE